MTETGNSTVKFLSRERKDDPHNQLRKLKGDIHEHASYKKAYTLKRNGPLKDGPTTVLPKKVSQSLEPFHFKKHEIEYSSAQIYQRKFHEVKKQKRMKL